MLKLTVGKQTFNVEIYLFASRINCQLKSFLLVWLNPEASAVDLSTLYCSSFIFYASPSFAVISKVFQKNKLIMQSLLLSLSCHKLIAAWSSEDLDSLHFLSKDKEAIVFSVAFESGI